MADGLAPCGPALHPQIQDADLPSIDSHSEEAHSSVSVTGGHMCVM